VLSIHDNGKLWPILKDHLRSDLQETILLLECLELDKTWWFTHCKEHFYTSGCSWSFNIRRNFINSSLSEFS